MYTIVGLGNPGEEYAKTRHSTGHLVIAELEKKLDLGKRAKFLVLDEFMNNSGRAVAKALAGKKSSKKDIAKLVVIHDELDLALGTFKISFNKGPGGHNGVRSIVKALKTQEFIRIRVGISPSTPSGKLKKPIGEKKVLDFILGEFKPKELEMLKKVSKKIAESVSVLVEDGIQPAMNQFN